MSGVAVALLCSVARAGAQELRLTVRDSLSRQGIPAAVVTLLDSTGGVLTRRLTTEQGEVRLALPAGARRVQLLRIGFRPREAALPEPVDGVVSLALTMRSIPTLLEPVHVVDSPNCPRRDDRVAAFALWEQARSALLAAVVARETERGVIKRLRFDRQMDAGGFTAVAQIVHVDSTANLRPFVATHPAAEFIEHGFVDDSGGVSMFNGPDADVMLDAAFPRGYCFQLADADPARPHQVGLAFEAAAHKRGRVDVAGAVWIDSTTRSLDEIVFRYVGLDRRFDRYEPGGRVSFHTLSDGAPIIDRWVIRPIGFPQQSRYVIIGPTDVHENGGEVAWAEYGADRTWKAALGTLTGVVTRGGVPASGQHVTLLGTDYQAVSDSAGRFTIADLLPGPYTVAIADSVLTPLDILLKTKVSFIAARDSTQRVAFEAPSALEYARQACPRQAPGGATIIGRVTLPDGRSAVDASVESRVVVASGPGDAVPAKVDDHGLFHFCNVPIGITLELRAQRDARGATSVATETLEPRREVEAVRLVLHPLPPPAP